jgi:sec-independent protein translocase protein TatA
MSDLTQHIVALWTPQGLDWLWILLIVVVIFGKKLPDVARSLGKSLTQFKKGLREAEDEVEETKKEIDSSDQAKDTTRSNDSSKT